MTWPRGRVGGRT